MRLDFEPADAAQIDFGSGLIIPHTRMGEALNTWTLVMTPCWWRHQYADLILDQSIATADSAAMVAHPNGWVEYQTGSSSTIEVCITRAC